MRSKMLALSLLALAPAVLMAWPQPGDQAPDFTLPDADGKLVTLSELRGQRVIVIDDSIVRGNTSGPLVRLLREAGAPWHRRVVSSLRESFAARGRRRAAIQYGRLALL